MLLPERGKQAISNETKGGQPPFAFLAVMSLKTARNDSSYSGNPLPFSISFTRLSLMWCVHPGSQLS
jgi:hypothetical protein